MAGKNIWASVYVNSRNIEKIGEKTSGIRAVPHKIHRFRDRIDSAIHKTANPQSAAVLSALVVGKRKGITRQLQETFSRAGASHLLAISGLHIGIIAACSFLIFRLLLSNFRGILLRAWTTRAAAFLTLVPVAAYMLISGMSPSTQRAGIMAGLFLFAFILEKPYHPVNTLAAAALFILAAYPPGLFSISFQLSFAAVSSIFFGLYLFSGTRLFRRLPEENNACMPRLLKRVTGFVLISFFAVSGTMPMVMYYFNQAPLAGVASNLILIPWIGFVVVPAGLVSALVFVFSETAGVWCLMVSRRILEPAISVIEAIAGFPFGSFSTVTPTAIELICAYSLMICFGLAIKTGLKQHRKTLIVLLCMAFLAAATDAGYWIHRRFLHKDLRVTVMDVGHGHSALLELPGGETMLIDGGGFSDNAVFDVGRRIVAPCLRTFKIGTIDTVVLSHPDADHLNGLLYVLENFRVGRVVTGPSMGETESWKRFLKIIEKKDIPHPPFERTPRRRMVGGAEIELLYPWKDSDDSCGNCSGSNNCSIVLRVGYRDRSVLFPGDIEKCAESEVVSGAGSRVASDILIAPHHGSGSSSSMRFLNAVDPDAVIISARQSGLRSPSAEVLARYKKFGCRILRTDENGAIFIKVEQDGKMNIKPAKDGMGKRY